MTRYRNIEEAFLHELRQIVDHGDDIEVRGNRTRELRARLIELDAVRERCILLAGRNNNIFASIAESMWVLNGRDDLDYLSAYLPRAPEFSDDGQTWRAAYGPRLRNWNGIDQLAEILAILSTDLASRRAVAVIFDPDRDFVESKDVPCNNWLHFLARDGRLDLHVVARSTDIWWGFSGINAFEWSLLLEMMAFWLELAPGRLTFFTSSLHLYQRHFKRAEALLILGSQRGTSLYASRPVIPQFATPWESFNDTVSEWMRLEAALRGGASLENLDARLTDPLLKQYIQMIDLFWNFKRGEPQGSLDHKLAALGDSDLARAAMEFLARDINRRH